MNTTKLIEAIKTAKQGFSAWDWPVLLADGDSEVYDLSGIDQLTGQHDDVLRKKAHEYNNGVLASVEQCHELADEAIEDISRGDYYDAYLKILECCEIEREYGDCPSWAVARDAIASAGSRDGYEIKTQRPGSRLAHYCFEPDSPTVFFDHDVEQDGSNNYDIGQLDNLDHLCEIYEKRHNRTVTVFDRADDADWAMLPVAVQLRQNNDVI